jgi:endoglycosylceramidase
VGSGAPVLPYLHVVIPPASAPDRTPYLADPAGREVILRGVAAVGMQDVAYPDANGGPAIFPVDPAAYAGTCPTASPLIPQPPLCEVEAAKAEFSQSTAPGSGDDFAQMRQLGFDVVRLVLNWSQLEPTPGTYAPTYLSRVAQVVGWARQQGIYVILDMHQDQYSRFILPAPAGTTPAGCSPSGGSDGAPAWAVFTDGKPACAFEGQAALNPASSAAFSEFWHNHPVAGNLGSSPGPGLQDHYIGALTALADRFTGDPTVLGYEIMNEPQPGSLAYPPLTDVYQASAQDLYPFYKRVTEALTGVRDGMATCTSTVVYASGTCAYPQEANVSQQAVFYEPMADRNLTDFSIEVSAPFSSYPNLVYAPHVYTPAFTADSFMGYTAQNSPYPPSYDFGYQTAMAEAQAMHSAVLTTEFGDNSGSDADVLAGETAAQDATQTGSTVWAWKGLSGVAGDCWCVRGLTTSYRTTSDGTPGSGDPRTVPGPDNLIPSRQSLLARIEPRAVVGEIVGYVYDPTVRTFVLEAKLPAGFKTVATGDHGAETLVYIPPGVPGTVSVSGQAKVDTVVTEPDGSRLASIAPQADPTPNLYSLRAVDYTVTVGNVAVPSQPLTPLKPIGELQARAAVTTALADAAASTDPAIKAKAALAGALAGFIFGPSDPNAAAGTTTTTTPG